MQKRKRNGRMCVRTVKGGGRAVPTGVCLKSRHYSQDFLKKKFKIFSGSAEKKRLLFFCLFEIFNKKTIKTMCAKTKCVSRLRVSFFLLFFSHILLFSFFQIKKTVVGGIFYCGQLCCSTAELASDSSCPFPIGCCCCFFLFFGRYHMPWHLQGTLPHSHSPLKYIVFGSPRSIFTFFFQNLFYFFYIAYFSRTWKICLVPPSPPGPSKKNCFKQTGYLIHTFH